MTYKEAKATFKGFADKQALLVALSGNLTIQQRNIIKTVDVDGLTLQEASDSLHISISSLKRKRDKAYKILAELFEIYPI